MALQWNTRSEFLFRTHLPFFLSRHNTRDMRPATPSSRTPSRASSTASDKQQQRGKHIEVCVRLRPLVIEKSVSSSSFFHALPSSSSSRKPAIPRPGASKISIPGITASTTSPNQQQQPQPRQSLSPESVAQEAVVANTTTTYAWDVVDADTVAQNAATDVVPGRTHTYTLDRVYGPDTDTRHVYQQSVRDLVRGAMDGYHTAVLAYGQTATGKTHTMTGTVAEPGFIPLAVRECFAWLSTGAGRTGEYLLRVSYLEVYKEHIKDLLSNSSMTGNGVQPIRLFESAGSLQIRGLKEVVVTSPEQVFQILAEGEARRQVGATHLNQHSSRSHVLVRLWIESRTVVSGRESVRVSSLSLVDLAGSESVRLTGSSERRTEGHYINKSLMTLGQVVYALSEAEKDGASRKPPQHVPYRDSKLTRLLQPSLSGNAQVVLLCCISPLATHIEESHNTFKFAVRAKKIPQKAVLQEQSATDETTLLQSYRAEIEDLKQQLKEAQDAQRLQLLQLNIPSAEESEEKEMQELVEAIQTMERLILKTRPVPEDSLLDASSEGDFSSSTVTEARLLAVSGNERDPPSTPDRTPNGSQHNGNGSSNGDVMQLELSRIQGLLGSVLKKRRGIAATAPNPTTPAISEEEVRSLRAALEQQEVATSLRQADSSFLQAQLEEKDNLLAEVSKLLEAVEERQGALEAENSRLRRELAVLRATMSR